jgi:type II secretory pathway component GspD/PulD (secretin)
MISSLVTSFVVVSICLQTGDAPKPLPDSPAAKVSDTRAEGELVLLQFRDQDWQTALGWLAEKLKLNLDWQTLPEDKLSLSSTQEITLEAAEDLFNMQLLARGFVLLKRDGVLRLVALKDIDITLVPRVDPEDLEAMPKHSVARVSFPLEWMIAEEAAKELQPLLSPYGKLSPMASANRLEVVDAVVNLREFHRLLLDAENDDARKERVAEFVLKYRKVDEIAPKVRQLLGLPPDNSASSSQTQLDIEQARFRAEAIKQMGRDARDLVTEKKPTVFLVVNDKENSLLVNAPPNKIEIVRQAVMAMDKPLAEKDSAWETISRVKVYEVTGFDPDALSKMVASLQDRGTIAKETRMQLEQAYNRIIVFASPADQLTIAQLMDSFRAEKRTATVLPLANVDPAYATKAIQLILKTPERPSSAPGLPSDGKFHVEPDPQHSRLLLWATPNELRDVREFLARLGETFSDQPTESKLHVIEMRGQDPKSVTEKLKKIWPEISDSPLLLESKEESSESSKEENASASPKIGLQGSTKADIRLVANKRDQATEEKVDEKQSALPPVRLMQNGKGDLVILSRDGVAAETAKRLVQQFLKDDVEIRAIQIEHAQAYAVKRQLEMMLQLSSSSGSSKLTTSPVVSIEVDTRTNRLIIQNANAKQWETIQESIKILDQPNQEDDKLTREKVTYRFQHRKASVVAEALKGIYSDLLSLSDRTMYYLSNRSSSYNKNIAASAAHPEYQGLMSISVDQQANLIIISAPKYLIEEILKLVESMDTPVDGNAVAIIPSYDLPFAGEVGKESKTIDAFKRLFQNKR